MTKAKSDFSLFEVYQADAPLRGIVSIPHSGLIIPDPFKKHLIKDMQKLNADVDFEVHQLVDIKKLNQSGIAVIKANIHRTCIDLNRDPSKAVFAWKNNSKGIKIVTKEAGVENEKTWLATYYAPYFEMLKVMIKELKEKASKPVSFVDLHSMPGKATDYHMKQNPNQQPLRPDFCVSDQRGASASKQFVEFASDELEKKGYQVLINNPYVGGYITIHVNEQHTDTNNIQIEINRSLYMDEDKIELHQNKVDKLKPNLTNALINLFNQF